MAWHSGYRLRPGQRLPVAPVDADTAHDTGPRVPMKLGQLKCSHASPRGPPWEIPRPIYFYVSSSHGHTGTCRGTRAGRQHDVSLLSQGHGSVCPLRQLSLAATKDSALGWWLHAQTFGAPAQLSWGQPGPRRTARAARPWWRAEAHTEVSGGVLPGPHVRPGCM